MNLSYGAAFPIAVINNKQDVMTTRSASVMTTRSASVVIDAASLHNSLLHMGLR